MMLYQTPHFQVHMLPIDGRDSQYQVVSVLTGLVELKTSVLTNALYQADVSTKTLTKFFQEAIGRFNPQIGSGALEQEPTEEVPGESDIKVVEDEIATN